MGGGGIASNTATTPDAIKQSIDDQTNEIARAAAVAEPTYGSVSQLSGTSPNSHADVSRSDDGVYLISLPSAGGSNISLNTDENLYSSLPEIVIIDGVAVRPMVLYKDNGDSATFAGVYTGDIDNLGNWLAGGYWLHGTDLIGVQPDFEMGAFIDGPEIEDDPDLPTGGSAEYSGEATGIYVGIAGTDHEYASGSNILGEYTGDFIATANFENGGGTLNGEVIITESFDYIILVDSSTVETTNLVEGVRISWSDVRFTENGQATGDVSVSIPGLDLVENEGKTGNKFSTETDSEGNPRLLAGTHGGSIRSAGGTEAGYIGVHIGVTGE